MNRTDRHNNPTAFTTDIAKQAGLKLGLDYESGDEFLIGLKIYHTARLLGDPVKLTIAVIDKLSFFTGLGARRWPYMDMPTSMWASLKRDEKRWVIGHMYLHHEIGTTMKHLFVNVKSN